VIDIAIIGGTVVDGTGTPGVVRDIGIEGDRIVWGEALHEKAKRTIDASGMIVSPGFIDVHTHYDAQALWDPALSPSCFHGVTSVIGGGCGFSIAPMSPEATTYIQPMLARVEGMPLDTLRAGLDWNWRTFGEYLARLEGRVALNVGFMVGHSTVRRVVMGERAVGVEATEDEIRRMCELVEQSIAQGAIGFSTTVSPSHNDGDGNPVPSRHASRSEIMRLASVAGKFDGTMLEMLPNMDFNEATLDLLADFALTAKRPVNWNLLIFNGADETSVANARRQLHATDYARERGAEVVALMLPSTPTVRINLLNGFVFDALPGWGPLFRLSSADRINALKDPFVRATLADAALAQKGSMARFADWRGFLVTEIKSEKNRSFEGRTLDDIAVMRGTSAFDSMIELAIDDELQTSFQPPVGGEDKETYGLRADAWRSGKALVGGSDAGAHMDMIDSFAFSTKLLQKCREYGMLSIEEAVHLMTEVPCRFIGLRDRGVLREGYRADIVVFDPAIVGCGEVYTRYDLPGTILAGRLYADAIGVEHVIVNGEVVVDNGSLTGALPGAVLRPGRDTSTVDSASRHRYEH
jgi:N-acyl-D-aspartate/D-glutamate deacylase